jgi:hypothetical protein
MFLRSTASATASASTKSFLLDYLTMAGGPKGFSQNNIMQ